MDLSEAGDLPGALKKTHGSDMQRSGNSGVAMAMMMQQSATWPFERNVIEFDGMFG